jgi:hypothetical protein
MRGVCFASLLVAVAAACGSPGEPEVPLVLETDQTAYVAELDPDPRFDYSIRVAVKYRNETGGVVRIYRCTAATDHPPYLVQPADADVAAWSPDIACVAVGAPYQDLAVGQEYADTLLLRAPWKRQFNGQPLGALAGAFRLVIEMQICGEVNRLGNCIIGNQFDLARSNRFTISIP